MIVGDEILSTTEIAAEMRCSEGQAHRHRKAIRTMFGYEKGAKLTRAELWQWKDLFNRLTPTERKVYFEGLKVEKGGVEI